jgi:DNA-directed RNA polymerase III subunit RPC2
LAKKLRQKRFFWGPKKTPLDEAREALAETVLAHVPVRAFPYNPFCNLLLIPCSFKRVVNFNFKAKAMYLALMIRRVIQAERDPTSRSTIAIIMEISVASWPVRSFLFCSKICSNA